MIRTANHPKIVNRDTPILIAEDPEALADNALLPATTRFILNTDDSTVEESEYLPATAQEE